MKTKVIHSESKAAWNVVSTMLGHKYKIARRPYLVCEELTEVYKEEALQDAIFISVCFNGR